MVKIDVWLSIEQSLVVFIIEEMQNVEKIKIFWIVVEGNFVEIWENILILDDWSELSNFWILERWERMDTISIYRKANIYQDRKDFVHDEIESDKKGIKKYHTLKTQKEKKAKKKMSKNKTKKTKETTIKY